MNAFVTRLSQLTARNLLIAIHDALASAVALLLSYYLRFDGAPPIGPAPLLFLIVPCFVTLSVVVCYLFDLTTSKWRFVSIPDVFNILRVATVLSLALVAFDYILVAPNVSGAFFFGKKAILLFWCFELLLLGSSRFAYRYFRYTRILRRAKLDSSLTLLLGQTYDVDIFLRSIENGAVKRLWPVGLISLSPSDRGHLIRNIPVLGGVEDIEDIVRDFAERGEPITRVLMAPSAFALEARPESIIMRIRRLGLAVNRLPSIEHDEIPQLAPIEVENLLLYQRQEVDPAPIETLIRGRAIVVTGGGGQIGAEICRRAITFGASRLLVIENSESALVEVLGKLSSRSTVVDGRLANIRDPDRISRLMHHFSPDIVFHAAALRRQSAFDHDWSEAVQSNIFGMINVADAARTSGAKVMVVISAASGTQPGSIVNMTGEFAESFCLALDRGVERDAAGETPMRVVAVRMGDVLSPNGTLMTRFKTQIESGGPVTIAHPDMVRHFRTAAECCELMLAACAHELASGESGEGTYVLDAGQPIKILDLASRMIRLSGREPGHDIDIVYAGLGANDTLNSLSLSDNSPDSESVVIAPGISLSNPKAPPMASLLERVALLKQAVSENDLVSARNIFHASHSTSAGC